MKTITTSQPANESPYRHLTDTNVRVIVVATIAGLMPYEDAWNALAASVPQGQPMLSYAWVVSWLETLLSPDQTWKCFFVMQGDNLLCACPLIATKMNFLGITRYRVTPPNDLHTPTTDLLCHTEHAKTVADALIPAIKKEFPKLHSFGYPRAAGNSPAVALYSNGYRNGSSVLETLDSAGYLSIGDQYDCYDAYAKTFSYNFARNLRRLGRKLEELDATTEFVTDPARNKECLSQFMEIEASGWKGKDGAIKLEPKLVSFYTTLTERLAKLGWMEWQIMKTGDKILAVHMGVRCGRVINMMKISYDEAYASYSPSNILMGQMIRRAYDTRAYDEINFQSRAPWQKNWHAQSRTYYNLTVYPSSPISLVRGYMPKKIRTAIRHNPWIMSRYRKLRDQVKQRQAAKEKPADTDTE